VHIAYGELVRGAVEALRMIGLSFGQADDCAEGFVWTEAVLSRGYDLLRFTDEQRPSAGWRVPALSGLALDPRMIDLTGLPLLSYGARLADLTSTIAKGAGRMASVVAIGATGGHIAPYIAYRVARAGCAAGVMWKNGNLRAPSDAPDTLVMTAPAGPGEVRAIEIAPVDAYPGATADGELEIAVPADLISRIASDAALAGDRSAIIVLAADPAYEGQKLGRQALAEAAGIPALGDAPSGTIDVGQRLRSAIDHGLETPDANLLFFTGLLRRIRLPNTERSQNQAG
jgi:hypothetical protein